MGCLGIHRWQPPPLACACCNAWRTGCEAWAAGAAPIGRSAVPLPVAGYVPSRGRYVPSCRRQLRTQRACWAVAISCGNGSHFKWHPLRQQRDGRGGWGRHGAPHAGRCAATGAAPAARAAGRAVVAGLHSCPLLLSGMAWHWARDGGGAGRRCWPGWPVVVNLPGVTAGAGAYCQELALRRPGKSRQLLPGLRPLLTAVAHWALIGDQVGRQGRGALPLPWPEGRRYQAGVPCARAPYYGPVGARLNLRTAFTSSTSRPARSSPRIFTRLRMK